VNRRWSDHAPRGSMPRKSGARLRHRGGEHRVAHRRLVKAARTPTGDKGQEDRSRLVRRARQNERQAKQIRGPMRHRSGSKLPRGHLALAAHRARVAGQQMVQIVRVDRPAPPPEIWQSENDRPDPAGPRRARGLVGGQAMLLTICGQGVAQRRRRPCAQAGPRMRESRACPGAVTSMARAVSGLMPGRGGRLAGSLTSHASPSRSSSCTKRQPRSIWPG
jgi:hypothetical protein